MFVSGGVFGVSEIKETFYYRKHIFLVFECMAEDLRGALKKCP